MPTYKFEQFNIEIVNPEVVVNLVHDYIQVKECNVDVLLITSSATFGVTFVGYTYTADWNDQDIINWVNNVELPQYEIPQ
jgi:hypothetical protein